MKKKKKTIASGIILKFFISHLSPKSEDLSANLFHIIAVYNFLIWECITGILIETIMGSHFMLSHFLYSRITWVFFFLFFLSFHLFHYYYYYYFSKKKKNFCGPNSTFALVWKNEWPIGLEFLHRWCISRRLMRISVKSLTHLWVSFCVVVND